VNMKLSSVAKKVGLIAVVCVIGAAAFSIQQFLYREKILKQMIERLSADSRIAEVVVTKSELDEKTNKVLTTIKFLEYDAQNNPLPPKYFTFRGNIIQFQSLVIRFSDELVKKGDKLRGKSAYLFLRAFVLDSEDTQIFEITPSEGVPEGYRIGEKISDYEQSLWSKFWLYALDAETRGKSGIKNAQIEAPGTLFLPGTIYTLKIEHDGGMRIDTQPVPEILKGEKIA